MIIVDLIKELMYQENLSIEDMVDKTKLPYEVIANIVNKDIIPVPVYAEIILNVFGFTLEEVLILY